MSLLDLYGCITQINNVCLVDAVLRHFQQYFRYIVAVSFFLGGNLSQVTDKLYHIMVYTSP
jgi:hypothetical protein